MKAEFQDITDTAVSLSVIEIGLGSLVHAFRIPFRGHILSINQGLFLQNLGQKQLNRLIAARCIFEASAVTAILKSMFPYTNSLGPMMSIIMQGCLYALGLIVGGKNRLGYILGMSFLSVWGFVQPFVTYGLIFGVSTLTNTANIIGKLCFNLGFNLHNLWILLLILLSIKISLGFVLQYWFMDIKTVTTQKALTTARFLQKRQVTRSTQSVLVKVFHDLTTPLFLLTWILTLCCIFFIHSSSADFLWLALRPLAVGFMTFYVLRSPWTIIIIKKIFRKSQTGQRIFKTATQSLTMIENWMIQSAVSQEQIK